MDDPTPCPFCGNIEDVEVERERATGQYQYEAGCGECGCRGPMGATREDAWDLWNKRWRKRSNVKEGEMK